MQFIDLSAQYNSVKPRIDLAIQKVIDSAQFIMGAEVVAFESAIADFIGVKHCVSCANGTDAIQLVYMAWGIGAGDAVFCPDVTFFASIEPACMLGATPVFCDIDPHSYNISPESLERQIEAVKQEGKLRPRAVVAVDLFGNPAGFDAIQAICDKHGLLLLEDAAQSVGAAYRGRRCGSFGQAATTSFFPVKPLGCYGDGGAVFTDDDGLAQVLRSLRVHGKGSGGKYDNARIGLNSRLDTIQAAILIEKLKILKDVEIDARQKVAAYYDKAFDGHFVTPHIESGNLSVYSQYTLLAKDSSQRDRMILYLKERGIPAMVYYPAPQHKLPVFADLNHYGEAFANSTDYCARTFALPMHPYLTTEEMDGVIGAALEGVR